MAEDKAPVRRRQMGAHGLMFRRRRIFAQLREGYTYDEIAAEEGVSPSRQLDRLAPAIRLGAEGIAAGDIAAITPYLKALDRLGRYQAVATANQVYDDEARKKLMDKVNRLAENLGINEEFAAAVKAHLQKTGQIPADEPGEAEGGRRTLWAHPTSWNRRKRQRRPLGEAGTGARIFLLQTAVSP